MLFHVIVATVKKAFCTDFLTCRWNDCFHQCTHSIAPFKPQRGEADFHFGKNAMVDN